MDLDNGTQTGGKRTYQSAGASGRTSNSSQICKFFQAGNCKNGKNCRFIHPGVQTAASSGPNFSGFPGTANSWNNQSSGSGRGASGTLSGFSGSKRPSGNLGENERWGRQRVQGRGMSVAPGGRSPGFRGKPTKPCKFWLQGNCRRGDACTYLHAHSTASDVEMMTELKGHEKAVRGITLPVNTSQLYTGSQDGTVRVWDCGTGQCTNVENVGADVGSVMCESGWLFVGLPSQVKTYNMTSGTQSSLAGPTGPVHALCQFAEFLFAGCHDGSILAWKFNSSLSTFEPFVSLAGHTGAVISLEVNAGKLFSGSMDKTIRVWDLSTGQCLQTLENHLDVVMGLLCWEAYLISCSLDGTIKVWAVNAGTGMWESTFSFPEAEDSGRQSTNVVEGILALSGATDLSNKPVLLASFTDNSVRLFDLPSFSERGSLFSKEEVRAIHVANVAGSNIIFTGDGSGDVKVWRWIVPPPQANNVS